MGKWDERVPLALVDALFDAGRVTETQHRNAAELIVRGQVCEGLQYALRQAGIR
jgi:hypothetical protein